MEVSWKLIFGDHFRALRLQTSGNFMIATSFSSDTPQQMSLANAFSLVAKPFGAFLLINGSQEGSLHFVPGHKDRLA